MSPAAPVDIFHDISTYPAAPRRNFDLTRNKSVAEFVAHEVCTPGLHVKSRISNTISNRLWSGRKEKRRLGLAGLAGSVRISDGINTSGGSEQTRRNARNHGTTLQPQYQRRQRAIPKECAKPRNDALATIALQESPVAPAAAETRQGALQERPGASCPAAAETASGHRSL